MNVKHLIATTAIVITSGSAFAQQVGPYSETSSTDSVKSRADVIRELRISAVTGDYLVAGHEFVDPGANLVSSQTRAQIRHDLQSSKANGSYGRAHRDYADPAAAFASAISRAAVVAELRQAVEDGSYALAHQEYPGQFLRRNGNASLRLARGNNALTID